MSRGVLVRFALDLLRSCFAKISHFPSLFIEDAELSDIKLKIYKDRFPTSYFLSIGPKSIRRDGKEIFDPYINSALDELVLKNIEVNGEILSSENTEKYIKEIVFDDIYAEGREKSFGKIKRIIFS